MLDFKAAKMNFDREIVRRDITKVTKALLGSFDNEDSYEDRVVGANSVLNLIKDNEDVYLMPEEADALYKELDQEITSLVFYREIRSHLEKYKCPKCGYVDFGGHGQFSSFSGSDFCDVCEPNKAQYEVHVK